MGKRTDFSELGGAGQRAWSANAPPASVTTAVNDPAVSIQQAPPFPYQWVGRWEPALDDSGAAGTPAPMAVIAGNRTTWVVKRGDLIDAQWRVDAITATSMELTYLPLSSTQKISMAPQ